MTTGEKGCPAARSRVIDAPAIRSPVCRPASLSVRLPASLSARAPAWPASRTRRRDLIWAESSMSRRASAISRARSLRASRVSCRVGSVGATRCAPAGGGGTSVALPTRPARPTGGAKGAPSKSAGGTPASPIGSAAWLRRATRVCARHWQNSAPFALNRARGPLTLGWTARRRRRRRRRLANAPAEVRCRATTGNRRLATDGRRTTTEDWQQQTEVANSGARLKKFSFFLSLLPSCPLAARFSLLPATRRCALAHCRLASGAPII